MVALPGLNLLAPLPPLLPHTDSYDISVVDGFNVAVKLAVINPVFPDGCTRIGCATDPSRVVNKGYLNPAIITCAPQLDACVEELKIQPGGKTIGCYSL